MQSRNEVMRLVALERLNGYQAWVASVEKQPSSSSEESSIIDEEIYYGEGDEKLRSSVRALTSEFDEEIKRALRSNNANELERVRTRLYDVNQNILRDGGNSEELKMLLGEYVRNRETLMHSAEQNARGRGQQFEEVFPSSNDPSGFTVVGEQAQNFLSGIFNAVREGEKSPEQRGAIFRNSLNLSKEIRWQARVESPDELVISGQPAKKGFFSSSKGPNFQCRISNGSAPKVEFDLADDPKAQEEQGRQIAKIAAALAQRPEGDFSLVIYDTTGTMTAQTLLGIMDTLENAGVRYMIEENLQRRFENERIDRADAFSPVVTSPSLGSGR